VLSSSNTHRLLVFDTATATLIVERELDMRPSLVSFALDGTALVVFGQRPGDAPGIDLPGPPQLQVFNAETLEPAWSHTFDDMVMGHWCVSECSGPFEVRESVSWTPGVSITPDGSTLVAVHADRDLLTRVDLATGNVSDLELHADMAWYKRLVGLFFAEAEAKGATEGARRETAWAPDGSRLYVLTIDANAARQLDDDTGTVQVIDSESGRILQERAIDAPASISLAPNTRDVLVGGNHPQASDGVRGWWTVVFDATSLEPTAQLDEWQVEVVRTLDGRPILLAQRGGYENAELALIDAETYAVVSSWPVAPGQCSVSGLPPFCNTP
jgi:hypothetical protein